jgi:hypothetical protein
VEENAGHENCGNYSLYYGLFEGFHHNLHIPANELNLMLCVSQRRHEIGLAVEA